MRNLFAILVSLVCLSALVASADTVTVTNRGEVITVTTYAAGSTVPVAMSQAATFQQLKSLGNAAVGGTLTVDGRTYVPSSAKAVGARDLGYLDIVGTNLVFILAYTNGVALSPTITNVLDVSVVAP